MPRPGGAAKKVADDVRSQATEEEAKTAEQILKEHSLWSGWSRFYAGGKVPLGPKLGDFLTLPAEEEMDPDVVGLAYPLAPVEYGMRNERRHPPPSQEEQDKNMLRLLYHSLERKTHKPSYVLSIIYSHINRNERDSAGWQRAFMKAHGYVKLDKYANSEDPKERYWALAILGRMLGTSQMSREELLPLGMADLITDGCKDSDEDVRSCAISALKGLIQYPEGRKLITYDILIDCLAGVAGSNG
mmetsp:Transcript_51833/g.123325  ORF Transcript_51833/g.123325 Transcript_51833/m.123325 type:complete len:244 (+) Transcript_51833:82-813(+)